MDKQILLGFEVGSGREVKMIIAHTVVTGMTQLSGKTTTLEAIITRSGKRAIAFITKRGESGFKNGHLIQPFFRERSDWEYVSGLLEAVLREKMKFERGWIMTASKNTKSLREVYENTTRLKKTKKVDSLPHSIYSQLEEYLSKIVPQIETINFSKTLELENGINVMDLSDMTTEMRFLVIRSVMERVMSMRNVIVIIPEAWEVLPQTRMTPVKLYAEEFIRKGAAVGNYLFIDSQDIAGVDKTPLRQCNNWIMGRQRETHEIARLREIIGKRVTDEDIRTLKLGEFIAATGDDIKKVYVLPVGVPPEMGRRVAMGLLAPERVKEYLQSQGKGDEEMYKEKWEEAKAELDELRQTITALERKVAEKSTEPVDAGVLDKARKESYGLGVAETEARFQGLQEAKVEVEQQLAKSEARSRELQDQIMELQDSSEEVTTLREGIANFLKPVIVSVVKEEDLRIPTPHTQGINSIDLKIETPQINVTKTLRRIEVTDESLQGKVYLLYVEDELPLDKSFSPSDLKPIFERRGWGWSNTHSSKVNEVLNSMTRAGYLEVKYAGKRPDYRVKMTPADAKTLGLVTFKEKVE